MKQLFFTIFLSLTCLLTVQAQDSEQFGELIPYIKWLAKVEEANRKIECDLGSFRYKGKIKANFKIETKSFSNEEGVLVVEVQTNSSEVIFNYRDENMISRTRFFVRAISKTNNFDKVFEEIIDTSVSLNQFRKVFPMTYRRELKLPKDKYTFLVVINSADTELQAKKKFKLEIK